MKAWRVDRRVNNVKNNEPSLCEPIKEDALPRSPPAPKSPDANRKQMRAGSWECFEFFRSNGLPVMVQKSGVGFIETMDCLLSQSFPRVRNGRSSYYVVVHIRFLMLRSKLCCVTDKDRYIY